MLDYGQICLVGLLYFTKLNKNYYWSLIMDNEHNKMKTNKQKQTVKERKKEKKITYIYIYRSNYRLLNIYK